jgi:hydroxymethylpyrimidine pyrophosphatase-like HAD family hydrolase
LCNYEGVIPESAKQSIKQARKNGHKVYICTGRSRAEVYQEIWDIGLDGMIGGNGSYVEDQSKSVYHKKLSETEERAVVDWLHERGLEFLKACKETRSFKDVMNCLFFVLMTHEYEHMCYNN